ncbi:MAG: hypothetical protein ABR600_11945 [Actinomycetota bacterium]
MVSRLFRSAFSILALVALVTAAPGMAWAEEDEQLITDTAGDANGIGWHHASDGGGLVRATYNLLQIEFEAIEGTGDAIGLPFMHGVPVEQLNNGPVDMLGASFGTTYDAIPIGMDGIDYRATGIRITIPTTAVPRIPGEDLVFTMRGMLETPSRTASCKLRLVITSHGAGGLTGIADVSDPDELQQTGCPGPADQTVAIDAGLRLLASPPGLEIALPLSALPEAARPFAGEGAIFSQHRLWSTVTSDERTTLTGALDKTAPGDDFYIGLDMPIDEPCTRGCPG